MKKLIVIVILTLALFHCGHGLKCFKCNGCETTTAQKATCRTVNPDTHTSYCVTQRVLLSGAGATILKKCDAFEKFKDYTCQNLPDSETTSCQACQTDFCNSASKLFGYLPLLIPLFNFVLHHLY